MAPRAPAAPLSLSRRPALARVSASAVAWTAEAQRRRGITGLPPAATGTSATSTRRTAVPSGTPLALTVTLTAVTAPVLVKFPTAPARLTHGELRFLPLRHLPLGARQRRAD